MGSTAPYTLSRPLYRTQNSLNLTGLRNNSNGSLPAGMTPIPPPGFAASFVVPDLMELALGGYLEEIQVRIEGTASAREAALRTNLDRDVPARRTQTRTRPLDLPTL
ncbi:hypothetical protein RTBOTA2_001073 [Rhodotorula toruloides]|nr:hypothetical protein RTBOTA2_001073 [Rhodotorula toruloides]